MFPLSVRRLHTARLRPLLDAGFPRAACAAHYPHTPTHHNPHATYQQTAAMNAPPRSESYRLAEGERKCEWKDAANEKMPNSGTLTINKEDHTMGNLIRMQLLRDKQVKFAGYIHPHPLLHKIEVRVQTVDRNVSTPMNALENALSDLNQEFTGLKSRFQVEARRVREQQMERDMY